MHTFITFGGGGNNYIEAGERLIKQAQNLELFDNSTLYTDEWLKNDLEYWTQHKDYFENENNKLGYGYWIWKSYIIKKTMEKLNDGDVLLYLDCGCEIDIKKKSAISEFFEKVKNELIIYTPASYGSIYSFKECEYTKMDLFIEMDMLEARYLFEEQRQAGAIMFFVCEKTRDLVDEWYKLTCNYHNIDDTPSMKKNFHCFKEHRHDQSVFSLLTKKRNFNSKENLHMCIEYLRNISGTCKLNK
jgi:hypothetical protein